MLTLRDPQIVFVSQFASPIGTLWLASTELGLVRVAFDGEEEHGLEWVLKRFPDAKLMPGEKKNAEFHIELGEYFQGQRRDFTCKTHLAVSDFSSIVLDEVCRIPFGATASYKDIAAAIGMPTSTRAVGRALATNPVPVIVPCHRVVGSDGTLVGFGGGLDIKQWLLSHERGLLH
jgi:methylated-DNA-[protein]-cysteine S-methyltransferase